MSVILLLDENGEDITNEQLYCVEPDCLGEPWCTVGVFVLKIRQKL